MATIRRLYIYLICLISLQAVVAAASAIISGLIGWLTRASEFEALSFSFQLAVVIVGGAVFAGHWLWALYLARKDPAERNAWARLIYLYLTQGILMFYMGIGLMLGLAAVLTLGLPSLGPHDATVNEVIRRGLQYFLIAAGTGGLWFYHDRLSVDRNLLTSDFSRILRKLYLLAFGEMSLIAAFVGLVEVFTWLIEKIGGLNNSSTDYASFFSLAVVGGLVWLYHETAQRADSVAEHTVKDGLRWTYSLLNSAAAAIAAISGLIGTQTWLFDRLAQNYAPPVPYALAGLLASLPILLYHEWEVVRTTKTHFEPVRWLAGILFQASGLLATMLGLWAGLRWLFSIILGQSTDVPYLASCLLPGLLLWGYHLWVVNKSEGVLGLAEKSAEGFRSTGRLLRRAYVLGSSGLGLSLTTLGLVALQEWVFSRFGGQGVFQLADGLASLIVGVVVWVYYWRWAGKLFASKHREETRSDLRKAYLYLIIYLAVNTAIITIALLVNGLLRSLVGLPTSGTLGLPISIITVSTALWVYHALVLRIDINQAGESALQAGMQRLYWYGVAGLGLVALLAGLAGELSVVIRWLALGFRPDTTLREQFAGFMAALVAGLPVWLSAWVPAQMAAIQTSPTGVASRQSLLRKTYLYFFSLTAVIVTLSTAISGVYQLLNALFGVFQGVNLLADIAQSIGFTVIATLVWLYHGWVLRGDGQRNKTDKAAQAEVKRQTQEQAQQALVAVWAAWPLAVVDGGNGVWGKKTLAALKQDFPYLTLLATGLTPEAADSMGVDFIEDVSEKLAPAKIIVTTSPIWASVAVVASHGAVKVVEPMDTANVRWARTGTASQREIQLLQVVRRVLATLSVSVTARPSQAPA